jgi:hypothetical protein
MRTIEEYAAWLEEETDPVLLRREALERMCINLGLLRENSDLRRLVHELEQGQRPLSG